MSVLDQARKYVRDEYHAKLSLRTRMGILAKERLDAGDVLGAISAQHQGARLDGLVEGLGIAITQLQMVREEVEQ